MAKITVFKDSRSELEFDNKLKIFHPALQHVVDELVKLDLGAVSLSDVCNLAEHSAEKIVRLKILDRIQETPSVAGYRISPEKMLEQLELPSTVALQKAIDNLVSDSEWSVGTRMFILNHFNLINGKVEVRADKVKDAKEQFSIVAISEDQQRVAKACLEFVDSYKKLSELTKQRINEPLSAFPIYSYILFPEDRSEEPQVQPQFYYSLIQRQN